MPPEPTARVALPAREQVIRASLAVRGLRPSADEIALVEADPAAIEGLVDAWLQTPEFLETVRDLHAEQLLVRTDAIVDLQLPPRGPLADRSSIEVTTSVQEEPLRLVEHIVANDLPYSDIANGDYTVADDIVSKIYGLAYDDAGPDWQVTSWADGRPNAGLLASSQIWRRFVSAGNSFHRGRANFVANFFLCEDIAGRDVSLVSDANLADPLAVADAVATDPACVSCHQTLDPLAANLWGFVNFLNNNAVVTAYDADCRSDPSVPTPAKAELLPFELTCYPTHLFFAGDEGGWAEQTLRPPAYFGTPIDGLRDLGNSIAEDPRFATCSARRVWSWLAQMDRESLPAERAAELGDSFAASGFNFRELFREIVLSPEFLSRTTDPLAALAAPTLVTRPETRARAIAGLTGFSWEVVPDAQACPAPCTDQIDLMTSDLFGFRAMSGGIDGFLVTRPTHFPTAVKALTDARFAELAASWVVEGDAALPDAERRLFAGIDLDDTSEAAARAAIALLHERLLGSPADPLDVDETWTLLASESVRGSSAKDAWKLVISLLLQDPRMVMY